jgi:hypothetical protein
MAGTDPEELDIIDPDDNQPILPRRDRDEDDPIPSAEPPR